MNDLRVDLKSFSLKEIVLAYDLLESLEMSVSLIILYCLVFTNYSIRPP